MQKVLIAEHSEDLATALTRNLQDQWEIHICKNGYEAISIMDDIDPEGLIIDLNLPQKDGLAVLSEQFPFLPPVIIALTTFTSPYIEQVAMSLGVGYLALLPCNIQAITDRLTDMYATFQAPPSIASRHLHAMNFNFGLDGYFFLLDAIPRFAQNRSLRFIKELYPAVATACNANNAKCVEHSIRLAIKDAWERRDMEIWSHYFQLNSNGDIDLPTNRQFITRLSEML